MRAEEIPVPDEDFEDALDQEIEVEQASGPSSGSVPHAAAEVRMPETETEMQATDAWRKREAELKSSRDEEAEGWRAVHWCSLHPSGPRCLD